jgi:hypothetical protein
MIIHLNIRVLTFSGWFRRNGKWLVSFPHCPAITLITLSSFKLWLFAFMLYGMRHFLSQCFLCFPKNAYKCKLTGILCSLRLFYLLLKFLEPDRYLTLKIHSNGHDSFVSHIWYWISRLYCIYIFIECMFMYNKWTAWTVNVYVHQQMHLFISRREH